MAEGVDEQADNFRLESDDFHEQPCVPCAKDNRNVAAIKFCVDCDENICGQCVAIHNRYAGMKGHQISDTIKTTPGQGGPGLPSQRCDIHAGKLIDVYCADHDFVGCSTCIAIVHRSCKDVKYIPDVVPSNQTSKELQELNSNIQQLEKRIDTLKLQKANYVQHLNEDKERIVQEIRSLRQKINDHLEQMENRMLEEVDSFFEKKTDSVDDVVTEIKSVANKIKNVQESLNSVKKDNESVQFVELKKSKSIFQSNSNILKSLEDGLEGSSCFYKNKTIENLLQCTSTFGYLTDEPSLSSIPSGFECNVRLESDQHSCEIMDICLLKSGYFVLTDDKNLKVKLFDSCFTAEEYIETPGEPFGVCEVDNNRIAITLFNKNRVQFISLNPLQLQESFDVGDRCRAIDYYAGQLFVGCGGLKEFKESVGQIKIYDTKGKLLKSFYEYMVCPWYMNVCDRETQIVVSNFKDEHIILIDCGHNKAEELKIPNVTKPSGSCNIGETNQVLVCGFVSNNIILLSGEHKTRELLTQRDGILNPRSLVYDIRHSRLIVILDKSNLIKVFSYRD